MTIAWFDNKAPAFVPECFLNIPQGDEENAKEQLRAKTDEILVDPRSINPQWTGLRNLKEAIQDHVEMRIQLFAMQLLLVKDIEATLLAGCKTYIKIGRLPPQSTHENVPVENGAQKESPARYFRYQPTLCAVLPSLKYQRKGPPVELEPASYLAYCLSSTSLLPIEVSQIDFLIDRKDEVGGLHLRDRSLQILNNSTREKEPRLLHEFLLDFVNEFLRQIARVQTSPSKIDSEKRAFVLDCYHKVAHSYQDQLQTDPTKLIRKLFFRFQGVQNGDVIDERFYHDVQQEMRLSLKISPEEVVSRGLTVAEYKNYCMTVEAVRQLALRCLQDPSWQEPLKQCVEGVIKRRYNKKAQKLSLIVESILTSVRDQQGASDSGIENSSPIVSDKDSSTKRTMSSQQGAFVPQSEHIEPIPEVQTNHTWGAKITSSITSVSLGAWGLVRSLFDVSLPEPVRQPENERPFGLEDWQKTGLVSVDRSLEIPKELPVELSKIWNGPCPIWEGKTVKETHHLFLCLEEASAKLLLEIDRNVGPLTRISSPYWCLITREVVPRTRLFGFDRQQQLLKEKGYEVPRCIAIALGFWTAKKLGRSVLVQHEWTRCLEQDRDDHWVMGFDFASSFAFRKNNWDIMPGMVGVRCFDVK